MKQADYDLEAAQKNFEMKIYALVCFLCEQSAQKALKAYLYFKGERYIWEHSIQKLVEKAKKYDGEFEKIREMGAILDKYYLITRYPDAVPSPAVPFESFTEREAKQAIDFASQILNFVKERVKVK